MKRYIRLIALLLVATMLCLSAPLYALAEDPVLRTVPEGYNENDYLKAVAFLEIADEYGVKNGEKMFSSYDPNDPETWHGLFEWGEEYGSSWEENEGELRLSIIRWYCFDIIGDLNLDGCSYLTDLYCGTTNINSISILGCTSLKNFACWENENITELDLTQCPELIFLNCDECRISQLDLSNNSELEILTCCGKPMETLDISNNPKLSILDCTSSRLSELNTSNNPLLVELDLSFTYISSLDLSNNINLMYLNAPNYFLTELDVSCCRELVYIDCTDNDIRSLDFSKNPHLPIDEIRAEGGGFVGCTLFGESENGSYIIARPEDGCTFEGWYAENGLLLSTNDCFGLPDGFSVTVFIARFSGGPEPIPGDVDGSGDVSVSDAVLALRAAMGIFELAPEQFAAAGMDASGEVSVSDAIMILRTAMGLIG